MTSGSDIALSAGELKAPLEAVLAEFVGETVSITGMQQLTAGAAAQTWRFQARYAGREQALILRRGVDADQFAGALGKADEARVVAAAAAAGVCAPRTIGILSPQHQLGEGFVMECIEGETLPPRILKEARYRQAREKLAAQCGEVLARIHAVPLQAVNHLPVNGAGEQIGFYESSYRQFDYPLPIFDAAFQVLRRRIDSDGWCENDQTLVHGDFRNGNIIVDEEGLRAVLDWELAHIGDPLEDLGWLCVNSWRFGVRNKAVGGFGDREQLYRAYEAAGGKSVDPNRVAFWELFGVLKWGVICLYQCQVHLTGAQRSVERAAIGRRVSECELDIVDLLERWA